MIALIFTGQPLATEQAPAGIVSYELAGSLDHANTIRESWNDRQKMFAALNLGLDYLYLIAYSHFLALLCILVGDKLTGFFHSPIKFISLLLMTAALLDAIENYGLITHLFGSQSVIWPIVSKWCAVFKFFFVGLGIIYVLSAGIVLLFRIVKKWS